MIASLKTGIANHFAADILPKHKSEYLKDR